jgi:hypothetical protein
MIGLLSDWEWLSGRKTVGWWSNGRAWWASSKLANRGCVLSSTQTLVVRPGRSCRAQAGSDESDVTRR